MKILNIHGYGGSSENSACLVLREMNFEVISPQIDYDAEEPGMIFSNLKKIAEEERPDYIVGTSLGGFFAFRIASCTGLRAVLVNPCLRPCETLPELGYVLDETREREFELLSDVTKKTVHGNITAIIGGRDEVIGYHETVTRRIIEDCTVIPNGRHSGGTLPLKEFFGEKIL